MSELGKIRDSMEESLKELYGIRNDIRVKVRELKFLDGVKDVDAPPEHDGIVKVDGLLALMKDLVHVCTFQRIPVRTMKAMDWVFELFHSDEQLLMVIFDAMDQAANFFLQNDDQSDSDDSDDDGLEHLNFTRIDSLRTKMMIGYAMRRGIPWLRSVLQSHLQSMLNEDTIITLDPVSIYKEIHQASPENADAALADKETQEILIKNHEKLLSYCTNIMNSVFNNATKIPLGIRCVCHSIFQSSEKAFAGKVNEENKFTILGGFFFLRFLIPQIWDPFKYDIVHSTSDKLTMLQQKNSRIICDVLKKLTSGVLYKNSKRNEKYMTKMNNWIEETRPKLTTFFNEVTPPSIQFVSPEFFRCSEEEFSPYWTVISPTLYTEMRDFLTTYQENFTKEIQSIIPKFKSLEDVDYPILITSEGIVKNNPKVMYSEVAKALQEGKDLSSFSLPDILKENSDCLKEVIEFLETAQKESAQQLDLLRKDMKITQDEILSKKAIFSERLYTLTVKLKRKVSSFEVDDFIELPIEDTVERKRILKFRPSKGNILKADLIDQVKPKGLFKSLKKPKVIVLEENIEIKPLDELLRSDYDESFLTLNQRKITNGEILECLCSGLS